MITAESVAKKLKKPQRKSPTEWLACCPAHDDRTPSLNIRTGKDGRLLWHCHAGCDQIAVRDALETVGAIEKFIPWDPKTAKKAFPESYPCPRTHIYRAADGKPSYLVKRQLEKNGGKTFRQFHIRAGEVTKGMEGVTRLPYQLHLIKDQTHIFIVEGEQSADALIKHGYAATCNSGGAGNWKQELNEHFHNKHVTLIPDNDDPGRKHAKQVAEQLQGIAQTITIANLTATLGNKEDMVQWIARNPDRDLFEEAAKYSTPTDGAKGLYNPKLYTAADWLKKKMPPRDYLMGTLLCTTSRWMIFAPTGLGKTLFTMNLVAAISAGKDFLSWKASRKARVLYIDGEMPAETFKERITQVTDLFGEDIELVGINRDDEVTEDYDMPPLNTDEGFAWLKNKIETKKPDIITFDSIMCLLAGDMKDEEIWEPVKKIMKWLTSQRIAQIWVHHTGHDAGRSYGTSTREWELDTVLKLERPQSGGEGFVLNFTKARLKKHNNAEEFIRIHCQLGPDGWTTAPAETEVNRKGGDRIENAGTIKTAYEALSHNTQPNVGHDGNSVIAVSMESIRAWAVNHGHATPKEDGKSIMNSTDRKSFDRAKKDLIQSGSYAADSKNIWKIR